MQQENQCPPRSSQNSIYRQRHPPAFQRPTVTVFQPTSNSPILLWRRVKVHQIYLVPSLYTQNTYVSPYLIIINVHTVKGLYPLLSLRGDLIQETPATWVPPGGTKKPRDFWGLGNILVPPPPAIFPNLISEFDFRIKLNSEFLKKVLRRVISG